jgi:hypothetical protein
VKVSLADHGKEFIFVKTDFSKAGRGGCGQTRIGQWFRQDCFSRYEIFSDSRSSSRFLLLQARQVPIQNTLLQMNATAIIFIVRITIRTTWW